MVSLFAKKASGSIFPKNTLGKSPKKAPKKKK